MAATARRSSPTPLARRTPRRRAAARAPGARRPRRRRGRSAASRRRSAPPDGGRRGAGWPTGPTARARDAPRAGATRRSSRRPRSAARSRSARAGGRESRSDTRSRSERSRRFASARIIRPFARGSPIIERMPRPVLRLFLIAIVARTPYAAISLLLIVRTKELTGSYAASGLVVGALSVALAVASPWIGRLVDRRGQTAVLRVTVTLSSAALVSFALVPRGAPLGVLVVCAAAAGAAPPPVGAWMRPLSR